MKQIPLTEEEQKLKTIFQTHTDILSRPFFQPALAELSEKCGTDLAHLLPISLDGGYRNPAASPLSPGDVSRAYLF